MRFDDVGNDNMSRVLAVDRHMDDRSSAVAVTVFDAQLFNIRHTAAVDLFPVGLLQTLADGVGGGAFSQRRIFQKLLLIHRTVMNGGNLKHALR